MLSNNSVYIWGGVFMWQFYRSIKLPLFINVFSFYTLWPHTRKTSTSLFGAFYHWSRHIRVSQYCHYSEGNDNLLDAIERAFVTFITIIYFQCYQRDFRVKLQFVTLSICIVIFIYSIWNIFASSPQFFSFFYIRKVLQYVKRIIVTLILKIHYLMALVYSQVATANTAEPEHKRTTDREMGSLARLIHFKVASEQATL
jgi:hypothetical protein